MMQTGRNVHRKQYIKQIEAYDVKNNSFLLFLMLEKSRGSCGIKVHQFNYDEYTYVHTYISTYIRTYICIWGTAMRHRYVVALPFSSATVQQSCMPCMPHKKPNPNPNPKAILKFAMPIQSKPYVHTYVRMYDCRVIFGHCCSSGSSIQYAVVQYKAMRPQ